MNLSIMNLHPGILDLRFRIVNIVYKNVKPQKLFKIKKKKVIKVAIIKGEPESKIIIFL